MDKIKPSEFSLFSLDDQILKLEQVLFRDKVNVILFYNTNCLGCTGRAIPFGYNLLQENKEKLNLIVIHVDFGEKEISEEDVLSIFHTKASPFPIYRDKKALLYNTLSCEGTPHWIVLSEKGEVLNSIFGSQENAQMRLYYILEQYE